jgi:hypothetical protein
MTNASPDQPLPINLQPLATASSRSAEGRIGGPSYHYRGGCGLAGTIMPLVDLWLDERRLPNYMRLVPKAKP